MREIKFRGKRIDNGEWIYGYYFYTQEHDRHLILPNDSPDARPVDPESVGEHTGLKDKNGKEIYEGDILSRVGYLHREVWFDDGSYLIGIKNESDTYFHDFVAIESEVIGNIYENQELIEKV